MVDKPSVIIAQFHENYLKLPREVIKSTLQTHQRYFTLEDHEHRISNEFIVVTNKKDLKKLIKIGNERVVGQTLWCEFLLKKTIMLQ